MDAVALIFVLLMSATLALAAARAVLGVLLNTMTRTALRSGSGRVVTAPARAATGFSRRQNRIAMHERAASLLSRRAA